MAITGTRTEVHVEQKGKLPEGEIRSADLLKIPIPEKYSKLLYVVHPSTLDGDYKSQTQNQIQSILDAQELDNSRIVAIIPPQDCTYLTSSTEVTDIRLNASPREREWVQPDDLSDNVESITIIGGGIEKCLASVVEELKNKFLRNTTREQSRRSRLEINLPLDAVYMTNGEYNAGAILNHLLERENPLEAIVALLTTDEPRTGVGQYAYGELEIITSNGRCRFEISLNGENLATLEPKKFEEPEFVLPEPDALEDGTVIEWIDVRSKLPSLKTDYTFALNITTARDEELIAKLPKGLNFDTKIRHAKQVLNKYDVLTP